MKGVWKRKTRNNLKRIIFIFIGFCSVLSACTTQSAGSLEDNDLQTLLRILDKDLQQSEVYVSERLEKIADIQLQQLYRITMSILRTGGSMMHSFLFSSTVPFII